MCKAIEDMRHQERMEGFAEGKKEGLKEGLKEGIKEGIKEGKKEGLKEGKKEGLEETALRMLAAGKYALDEISSIVGLPLDAIQNLAYML